MSETNGPFSRMPARYQLLLRKVQPLVRRWIQEVFGEADDALFSLADNAVSNQDQNDLFQAMREVRVARRGIEERFIERLNHNFSIMFEQGVPPRVPAWSDRDLAWLKTVEVQASGIKHGRGDVERLESSAEGVFTHCKLGGSPEFSNPLTLLRLCFDFNQVLLSLTAAPPVKVLLYKIFYLKLLCCLPSVYRLPEFDASKIDGDEDRENNSQNRGGALSGPSGNLADYFGDVGGQPGTTVDDLEQWLFECLPDSYQILPDEAHVIRVVNQLFSVVLSSEVLEYTVKQSLLRLKIPVLILALQDNEFLSDGNHVARRLLNELASFASGLLSSGSIDSDVIAQQVEDCVVQVESSCSSGSSIFAEALAYFYRARESLSPTASLQQQRLQDAERAKAAAERARVYVRDAVILSITPLALGRAVPDVVQEILRGPWHNVMLLSYLQQGEDSLAWNEQLKAAQDLVWSVCGEIDSSQQLMERLPRLLDVLRRGFDTIAYDAFTMNRLLKGLEALHLLRLQGVDSVRDVSVTAPERAALNSVDEGVDAVVVHKLQPGSWFEMQRDGGKFKCRLAAIIREADVHIFVDTQGRKVAEYNSAEVAEAMAEGVLLEMEGNQMFDRALESVITDLRSARQNG